MRRNTLLFCGMLFSTSLLAGNFPQDFQAAMRLAYTNKPAEAEEAFAALAGQKAGKRATDESLAQAAYGAAAQKKYDKAMEYAGRIENHPLSTSCRMTLLQGQGKWEAILALCGNEQIENWPDALIFDARLCRGRAYAVKKDVANAEKDFLGAVKSTISEDNRALAYHFLGDLYREAARDDAKAFDAYGEVLKLAESLPVRRVGAAAIARAKLLAAQGRGAEAIAELDRLKLAETKDAQWRCAIQLCYGEVFERMGQRADALARYKAVATFEKAPEPFLLTAKKKVDELEKNP